MKTKSIVYCFVLAVGFLGSQIASAQVDGPASSQDLTLSVTGSALLRVTAAAPVKLSLGGATQAGAAIEPVMTNATSRLKISSLASVVEDVTQTRTITANVTTGGCIGHQTVLSVQLLAPNGNFVNYSPNGGTLSPLGLQVVSDNASNKTAVTLVSGITTCWSGTDPDDGYQINYEYKGVVGQTATSSVLTTVTFTIVGV